MRSLLAAALLGLPLAALARDLPPDQIFKRASTSIVQIAVPVTKTDTSTGSGVLVRHPNLGLVVVTNCHVLGTATQAFIKEVDGGVLPATLAARDRPRDLCLLRPNEPGALTTRPATLGDPADLEVGDRVYAIGAPRGFDLTLSDGLVSGFRNLGGTRLIQSTAPISNGSSGGGLFDARARLVGVTTMFLADSQAINFAVPVALVATLPAYVAGAPEPVGPTFPQWRVVHADAGEEFAVDASSIRSSAGEVSLWTRHRTDAPRQIEGVPTPVVETVTHYRLFCADVSWWFDEYVLRGPAHQVIESGRVSVQAREPIQEGSFGAYLHQNLCKS